MASLSQRRRFASLKKCPLEADFFNHAFGMTESAAADTF
jgi:hypothetical protein